MKVLVKNVHSSLIQNSSEPGDGEIPMREDGTSLFRKKDLAPAHQGDPGLESSSVSEALAL